MQRTTWRRWLRVGAYLAAFVVALGVLAYLGRNTVVAPLVVKWLAAKLEREHGWQLRVGATEGDWIDELRLADVELTTQGGSRGLRRLRARDVALEIRPTRLLSGDLRGIERADVRDAELELDFSVEGERQSEVRGDGFTWPADLPAGAVSRLRIALQLAGGRSIELEEAGLRLDGSAGGNGAELDGARLRLDLWPNSPPLVERGRASLAYDAGRIAVRELELDGDLALGARDATLDLTRAALGEVTWTADTLVFGGEIAMRGTVASGDLSLALEARGVELGEAWAVIAPQIREAPRALLDLSGSLYVVAGELSADAVLAARDACIAGRELDTVYASAAYADEVLAVAELDARRGGNHLVARAARVSFAEAGWPERVRSSHGELELDFVDVSELTFTQPPPGVSAHRVQLAGELTSSGITLASGSLITEGGALRVRQGSIEWGPHGDGWIERAAVDIDVNADFHDLSPLTQLIARGAWSGSAHGSLRLTGSLAQPLGRADLLGQSVVALGFEIGDVHALARADRERLHVESLSADGPIGHVEARGDWLIDSEFLEHAALTVSSERLADLWPSRFERGAFEVHAELEGPLGGLRGAFVGRARDLTPPCGRTLSDVAVLGTLEPERVRLDELSASFERVTARAALEIDYSQRPLRLSIERAHFERDGLALELLAPVEARADTDLVEIEMFELGGSAGRISARAAWREGRFEARGELRDANPMPLIQPFVPPGFELDRARGNFDVAVDAGAFALTADGAALGLRLGVGAPRSDLVVRASLAPDRLQIDELEWLADDGSRASVAGRIPFDLASRGRWSAGELDLRGSLSVADLSRWPVPKLPRLGSLAGSIECEFDLAGSWSAASGRVHALARALRVVGEGGAARDSLLAPLDAELVVVIAERLEIERFTLDAPGQLRADVTGVLELGGDLRDAVDRARRGELDAPVDLRASVSAPDLAFVAALAPDALRRTAGALSAELALAGTLSEPHWSGVLRLEHGEVRSQSLLPTLDRVQGEIEFEGLQARVRELRGEVSGGELTLSGTVGFDGHEPEVDVQLTGRDLLLVQQRDLRVRSDAQLEVQGALSALSIHGDIELTDGRYSERVDWLESLERRRVARDPHRPWFSLTSPPLADATFAIRVTSRRPMRIDNNVARATLRPSLQLRGTGRSPELVGTVFVETARVLLPETTLELRSGTVELVALEPRRPIVDLSLETRIAGHDITLQARGRSDELQIEPSSTPPLSRETILTLLLRGELPADASASESGIETAQVVAMYLGKDMLARWFGGGERDEDSLIERIEWTRGADVTKTGGSTFDARLRVDGPQQGPGRVMYLHGERDLYDRINFGYRFLWRRR